MYRRDQAPKLIFHFLPAGTHVTGIVGALANQYGFSGAAPAATLGHYRVFGCTGETANDLILAALERAYSVDHVDIVSLSLGGAVGWLDDTAVQIYQNFLATVGVQVVAAAGNDRSEGPFFSESPAAGLLTNAVASVYVLATNGCCGWRMAMLTLLRLAVTRTTCLLTAHTFLERRLCHTRHQRRSTSRTLGSCTSPRRTLPSRMTLARPCPPLRRICRTRSSS